MLYIMRPEKESDSEYDDKRRERKKEARFSKRHIFLFVRLLKNEEPDFFVFGLLC